jgi:thiol-disulfide isomerase/thioredoxin
MYADFGNIRSQRSHFSFASSDGPTMSNGQGEMTIAATAAFDAKFADQPSAPIYFWQEKLGLIAKIDLQRSDFSDQKIREVRLSPACRVHGELTSVGLKAAGKTLSWTNAIVFEPGGLRWYTLDCACQSSQQAFNFPLLAGDYGIQAYGTDCDSVCRYFHIEPGQRALNLQLDLPPDTVTQLIGRPAPEFRNIKGWEHGEPVKLADLRGKVVLLDFWGYWCGPCVGSMPNLMKLHDEFKDKGLVIIAVHDDSADSIADMEKKLETVRHQPWAGWGDRDLPFLVALDGGGPTRIKYSSATARGATTAAYGIHSFPTTVVIARDGRVVGGISVRAPDIRSQIQKLLGE